MDGLDSAFGVLFPADHAFGCLSLLPPVTAIVLAIATRRVLSSLLAGIFVGALLLAHGNPLLGLAVACEGHLWPSLTDTRHFDGAGHLRVFTFTLLMGAMVGVMQRGGGMNGLVNKIAPLARTRRGGQLTVWLLGLVVFFDDYANSLLLGHTMRPLTDRLKISREKLAYVVDSTAAPVSGLALISTWVAGEIGFIQDGFASIDLPERVDGFAIFVATIPFRFYVLWALLLVPLVALLGRDVGEMLAAEREAQRRPPDDPGGPSDAAPDRAGDWTDAIWPVVAVVGVTLALILLTGTKALAEDPAGTSPSWLAAFGKGDSYLALVYGALAGLLTAMALSAGKGVVSWSETISAAGRGARGVMLALAILWLAWALSGLTGSGYLGTGDYLGGLLREALDVRLMPTVVFLLAAMVAFATGTSWGTMGLLMPLVVAVTYRMLGDAGAVSPYDVLLVATIGSVLAGAIFGDHCSPISDTTVLSSQASGCNHIAHVRTQLPYALAVAVIAVVCGTLPVGFGVSVWLLLPLGVIAMIAFLLVLGRRLDDAPPV